MHTRSIISCVWNSGSKDLLVILLISIFTVGCNHPSDKELNNPDVNITEGETIPGNWTIEKRSSRFIQIIEDTLNKKLSYKLIASPKAAVILRQNIILEDSGSYAIFGKFNVVVDRGKFFVSASTNSARKEVEFDSDINICPRILFSVLTNQRTKLDLRIGFTDKSEGHASLKTLYVFKEKYFEDSKFDPSELQVKIEETTGVSEFTETNFDENVDRIVKGVNDSFLGSRNVSNVFATDLFSVDQTSYLYQFSSESSTDAYCQKSSLSVDELLKLYNIPVRQLHWQRNCTGFHQFLEYWNPFDSKWKIIDPFYGIRYVDHSRNYLGYEDIEKLIGTGKFSASNIEVIDVGKLYYSEKEILDGWLNGQLAVRIMRK